MLRSAPALRRSVVVLGAGLLAGVVLTGCGGGPQSTGPQTRVVPAAATGSAGESNPPSSDLTKGLLSAGDLGAQDVHQFSLDGDHSSDHPGRWGWGDAKVTPQACATAVQDTRSGLPGLSDGVGQVARTNEVRTFEALAVPQSPVDAVADVRSVVKACDGATIAWGNGDHGSMTVNIDELSGAPAHTAAFKVTVSGNRNDGTWTATTLLGVGEDGKRVLGLAQTSWDQQLDTSSFTHLLDRAYQVQHDALG